MSQIHQIYFLQRADGLIKIGTSRDFPSRLAQLTASHGMLGVVRLINGDARRERSLHRKFKAFHEYGEWFRDERGALTALISALPEGDELTTERSDKEWMAGEAALMAEVREKVEDLVATRMQRAGLKFDAALAAVTADYGFRKFFLHHIRIGRATTISAYGLKRLKDAYLAELVAALAHYRAEIAAMPADDDEEMLAVGQRLNELEAEFNRRRKA